MAQWSIPFDVLAERAKSDVMSVVRMVALELFTRIVLRSPVDTGRFRANWAVGYGAPNMAVGSHTDKGGAATIAAINAGVLSMPVGGIIYLTNSLPYAASLEYGLYPDPPKMGSKKRGEDGYAVHVIGGYSMQAPSGMVRLTATEFVSAVRRAVGDAA